MELFFRKFRTLAPRAKRLTFEALERRDLLTVMRVVSWNALNGPNVDFDADFTTILEAVGNETVQGNTKRLDILALQETDSVEGADSIGKMEALLDDLYMSAGADYAFAMSTLDGGGDRTGFVYDTSAVSLESTTQIDLTHNILRGQFRPVGTLGESDFYVYTVHLSSGGGAAVRQTEAAALRADADSLPEGSSILVVGDFNMTGSSEGAWSELIAAGAGQLQDIANSPGQWKDNAAFKSVHTQDPGGAMDDRFDIQFASGELFGGVGIEYVDGSYHVFGNNGTHTFDSTIDTGTGASPAVLAALVAASDHLPVVVDYELIASTPNVRISETGGGTTTVEGGVYDVYSVVLNTIPEDNVTVTVSPDIQVDVGAGAGAAVQLVFTPANALSPQTVIVNAGNDLAGEGTHSGLVTHTSASTDLDYNGLTINDVAVEILDNDAPTIVINELDSDQTGTDMMEFVELYDGGIGNTSLGGMSVVFFNGNHATNNSYAVFNLNGHSTDANGFFVLGNAGITSRDFQFDDNTLENGQDAVALYSGLFPGGSPTTTNLLDAVVYDTGQADDAGLLILLEAGQPQVNENEGELGTTNSIARVPDHGTPRVTSTYVAQAPTPDAPNAPPPPGGYLLVQTGSRIDVDEDGLADSYQLSLANLPMADVTVTVDPDDQVDLGAGAGVSIVLTFTPANAIVPQTVTVTAVDDLLVEGNHTGLITHTAASADSRYNGLAIGNVVANIVDNESPVPVSIVISEIMYDPATSESGPGLPEWIEVANTGAGPVDLGGWVFDDEDGTDWGAIPASTILQPGQVAVFFDASFTDMATFRTEWAVPNNALVVGLTWGSLANSPSPVNEILELRDGGTQRDLVNYDDAAPWPTAGSAASIYLTNVVLDNNLGGSWSRSLDNVNRAHTPSGPIFSTSDVGSPGYLPVSADFNFDGEVSGLDFLAWQIGFGTAAPNALKVDGDADSDLDVDAADLAVWESDYGTVVNPLVAALESRPAVLAVSTPADFVPVNSSPPANVLLALPTLTVEETPAPAEDDARLFSAQTVDEALSTGDNPTTGPQGVDDDFFLTEDDSNDDAAADEVFSAWDELSLVL